MPYKPTEKYPDVIKDLNSNNYTHQAGLMNIRNSIMRVLGTVRPETISNHIRAMEMLGFIKDKGEASIFYLCLKGKPYNFSHVEKDLEKDADQLIENIEKSKPDKE